MSREMKDSGVEWIGEIPKDWEVARVKNAFIRKNEKAQQENPTILSLARSGVKVRDISTGEGQIAESYYNYNPVEIGDLLLNPMDLYSGANCSISKVSGVISPAYINLKAKKGYNSVYYDYYFKTQYWSMALFAHGKGVSYDNRWTLNAETLFNYYIPLQKYHEQQKIANFLYEKVGEIDRLIDNAKKSIEEYKKYKQSVITEAVTKGLNPNLEMKDSGIEWIGEISKNSHVGKIKFFVSKVGSGKTPKGGLEIYLNEGILFLRSQNIYDEGLNLDSPIYISKEIDEEMSNTRVLYNDVLLNITGGSIGRCCIYKERYRNANVNQHVSIIRVKEKLMLPKFMHYYWMSLLGKMVINLYQTGGNREGMSAEAIKNSPIVIFSISEQIEIINYLDDRCLEIDNLILKKEKLILELESYKKSLIYEYVTGKKEVKK